MMIGAEKQVKGFFTISINRPKRDSKVDKILNAIGAYNKKRVMPEGVEEYFDFNLYTK
jgi:hypothetical protein